MPKGKKVGKYELGRVLGSGAFSTVKLGMDDNGRQVAVKVIEKEQVIREKLEEQLKLEISIMRSLNHPNIVRLFDVLQTSNNIYIILELVTGGELFDRIVSARRFNEPTARRYFQQIVVALQFCHAQGIAHRDLKPENLLLSDQDNIKITDYGLATMHAPGNPGQLEYTLCGTPNYLAPEMLKDRGYIPVIADVWSVGVILYVMLSGSLPFDDPDLPTLFKKIERGQYKVHPGFTESARDLIGKMLTLDPAKRPTLLQVMQHPWFVKDFDRSVWDGLNGTTVTADTKNPGWEGKQVSEKDTTAQAGITEAMGAFEIVSQLSMVAMRRMTTNHPVTKISTRFIVGQTVVVALKSISEVLAALGATVEAGETPTELKVSITKPKGLLTFIVNLYSFVDPEMSLVEVRRGRGDTFEFHDLYHALVDGLGEVVLSKPVTEE